MHLVLVTGSPRALQEATPGGTWSDGWSLHQERVCFQHLDQPKLGRPTASTALEFDVLGHPCASADDMGTTSGGHISKESTCAVQQFLPEMELTSHHSQPHLGPAHAPVFSQRLQGL